MKKFIQIVIASLSLSLITAPSNAAVRTGSSCSKAGMKSVVSGLTYTCIKSGKKLVWDNGVVVVKYPAGPTSFDDLLENYRGISYAAWSKSSAAIIASKATVPTFKFLIGPNTTLLNKNPKVAFELVSRLYSIYENPKTFTVLSFNFQDRDWAVAQMDAEVPSAGSQWIYDVACASKDTCWGGGMFTDDKGGALLVLTTQIVDTNHTSGTVEAHEYTHAIQQNQMKNKQPWPTTDPWPPTWYLEGQAEFSQNVAIYNKSFEAYSSARRAVSIDLFTKKEIDSKYIEEFFILNQPRSWFEKYDRWRQYDLGAMFNEVLASIAGPGSTMEVWRLAGTGLKFPDAFEKVYGISFYSALPIISKAIALELGRS